MSIFALLYLTKKKNMEAKNARLDEFAIIGISVRTTNKNGQSQKDIGELWGRFMEQNILAQIPNRTNGDVYCIYTDYESDFTGAYTTIIGCMVNSLDVVPKGFITKIIPAMPYKHYKATGAIPESVGKVWSEIWQSGMERQYLADFDVYGQKAQDPQNGEVDIYVS